MSRIFLIGLPASGKTHWGKAVAEDYGWEYYDTDSAVEEREGRRVTEVFNRQGEEYFRSKERSVLLELIEKTDKVNAIISCGGGTPVMYDNLQVMKENGYVIYLHVPLEQLKERLNKGGDRPLFNKDEDIEVILNRLLEQRKSFYEQAHYIINTNDITVQNFEKIIEQCTDRQ